MQLANFLIKTYDSKFKNDSEKEQKILDLRQEICETIKKIYGHCPGHY